MFTSVVPFIPNLKIANKKILYSDEELNVENKSLEVTILEDITEDELHICIEDILSTNLDLEFDTIQYSKQTKKLYIYSNKKLRLDKEKKYKNSNIDLNYHMDRELTRLSIESPNYENDTISLWSVVDLIRKEKSMLKKIKQNYEEDFKKHLMSIGLDSDSIYFSHYGDSIRLFENTSLAGGERINISEEDNKIKIERETKIVDPLFANFYKKNENLDEIIQYVIDNYKINLKQEHIWVLTPSSLNCINTGIGAWIDEYGVVTLSYNQFIDRSQSLLAPSFNHGEVCSDPVYHETKDIFELEVRPFGEELKYKLIKSDFKNTFDYDKIIKNIYVKIESCPKELQEELYEYRQNELEKGFKNGDIEIGRPVLIKKMKPKK